MSGSVIFVSDDSILGFAFVYLLSQKEKGLSYKTTITKEVFDKLKKGVINYASKIAGSQDRVIQIGKKKEYFSTKELNTGAYEEMVSYDPVRQTYFTTKPVGYLRSAYNKRNSDNESMFNMYYNIDLLSELCSSQSVR